MFAYIREHITQYGFSPSYLEIASAVGLKSAASVMNHVQKLQRKGLITVEPGKSRTIKLVEQNGPKTNLDVFADIVNMAKVNTTNKVVLAEKLAEIQQRNALTTSQWFDFLQQEVS